jgi:UDP-N-acetyl-D-glucosamine/UDP-N-acetyl-D-galactosamine dehydrogenase
VAELVDRLYASIITAGTHKAASIRVAEAAKVIENTQRDVNIALINELALIFNRMGIDTEAVLQAAGTKWNFLPFRPGLVGGHCIGVDPYYLTHKAQAIGYHPEIILAGRRLNDSMGAYVVTQLVKRMTQRRMPVQGARVLVMGLTFKENCPDLRNTRVVDILKELQEYDVTADVYDPWVNPAEAQHEYGITPVAQPAAGEYDAIILAVAHREFKAMGAPAIRALGKPEHLLYDLKYLFPASESDLRL